VGTGALSCAGFQQRSQRHKSSIFISFSSNGDTMKNTKPSGQSLLEFALTLPLLLLLVMGVFDLGRSIYYYSAIHNAAREGARYGAVNHCDLTGIKDRAAQMADLGDGLVVKEPQQVYVPGTDQLDFVLVEVEYTFEAVTPLVGNFLGNDGTILLSSEARQLVEIPSPCVAH
jgi:hypothetical protein